jgi:putative transposon-encoded protein
MVDRDALRILEHVFDAPRVVHKHGISVTIAGRVVRFGAGARGRMPELDRFVGSKDKVIVSYDASAGGDTRTVSVWTTDFRFLCIAPAIAAQLFGGEALEFTIGN